MTDKNRYYSFESFDEGEIERKWYERVKDGFYSGLEGLYDTTINNTEKATKYAMGKIFSDKFKKEMGEGLASLNGITEVFKSSKSNRQNKK